MIQDRDRTIRASFSQFALTWWLRITMLLLSLLLLGVLAGYRVNLSRSLPLGLYKAISESPVQRGSIVVVCLPLDWSRFARKRGYLGSGMCDGGSYGIGKMVLAIGGDIVDYSADGLAVNGKFIPDSRPIARDRSGRTLPTVATGTYVLDADELWLFSAHHRAAFDSRYFGPIRLARVQSVVQPILTDQSWQLSLHHQQ